MPEIIERAYNFPHFSPASFPPMELNTEAQRASGHEAFSLSSAWVAKIVGQINQNPA
jgi:hypothetical protein